MWPNQTKPLVPALGLADSDLGFFVVQQVRSDRRSQKESRLGLIQVVGGPLMAATLFGGLMQQFQWNWT
jgi:hypothetical protein